MIAKKAGWDFAQFFLQMAPITMPVLLAGLLSCIVTQEFNWFGFGAKLPSALRTSLEDYAKAQRAKRTSRDKARLIMQSVLAVMLAFALALCVAAVGLVGLMIIIILTGFNGITEESQIGHAFEEALPFIVLRAVFFSIVTVTREQHLFNPIIKWVLTLDLDNQARFFCPECSSRLHSKGLL